MRLNKIPVCERLHLSAQVLPNQVYERYQRLFKPKIDYALRNEKARDSFGQKGRDPKQLGSALEKLFSGQDGVWKKNLMLAKLHNQWSLVVGEHIGSHTEVGSYRDGVLIIKADSPVWATQLTYMVPNLKKVIGKRLPGLPIDAIKITGPQTARKKYRGFHGHSQAGRNG